MMRDKLVSYSIDFEIPSSYMGNLLDFIYQKYLLPQEKGFADISRTNTDGYPSLAFTVLDKSRVQSLAVVVKGGKPIELSIKLLNEAVPEEAITQVRQDILIAVELFEEKVRENTLFFAWREGEEIVPEEISGKEKKSINRMLLETQVLLFIVFISLGLFLFPIMGMYAPLVLMAIQFVIVLYSNKLIERTADWRITEDNPTIHLLEYDLPFEEREHFKESYPRERIAEIKKEVYEQTIVKKGEVDCETVQQVFKKFGLECARENLSAKKLNVYELVKKVAQKFGFPMPKIVVSNTLIPNAAASGPSPSRGVVLITTGLLVHLKEDEIISVLGHEFGHLKGRDPLLLFGLMGSEFLLRFYVLLPFFPIVFSSLLLFLVYFWAIMTLLYFIAKFFEARADLLSAIVIGQPQVLAKALEEIGFKRLLSERLPSYRIQEWLSFDPHPPIYFRVNRLRKIESEVRIKHPLFQSAKDVSKGFIDSM
ncbi:M56 family metallopeptidase [Candidatus Bathyarchaeota archaeon]|nr:M56 family metallopeptidase [Candidatus Bathyarchaeota archaeon]